MYVKIPAITKYRSINVFLYFVIISAISYLAVSSLWIFEKLAYIWFLFLLLFAFLYYFIPVNLLIIFVEYILVRYKRITPTITTAT